MLTLHGEHIYLRPVMAQDVDRILRIENDQSLWEVSDTEAPFTREQIEDYVANTYKPIIEIGQYRFMICTLNSKEVVGMIDLFDYDALNLRAGTGIVIEKSVHRRKGYGKEAISLILNYCRSELGLHQVYANILEDNLPSILLFEKSGFQKVGIKKDWRRFNKDYKNELLYQYIL